MAAARHVGRVFVGNIPWTVSRGELSTYFSQFGRIRSADVLFNNNTGMSRGYGFVQFQSENTVQDVLSKGNHILEGQRLTIKPAVMQNQRRWTTS